MTPVQYCEQKIARINSSFHYSFLFLEPKARQALTALYAFCGEVDGTADECRDVNVARTKLGWWREEVARIFVGTAQHPVGKALQDAVSRYNLPRKYLLEIIAGIEMDLDCNAYRSFEELSLYCYRVAAAAGLMVAEILGYEDRRTLMYAHDLGIAFRLTDILRDIAADAQRGRVYIAEDDMARFKITREDILHARFDDNMRALLAHQAERAERYYRQAFDHLPDSDRYRQRSGLIIAAVQHAVLKAISAAGYQVFAQRINLSPPRTLWIAWQTARREKQRYLERSMRGN